MMSGFRRAIPVVAALSVTAGGLAVDRVPAAQPDRMAGPPAGAVALEAVRAVAPDTTITVRTTGYNLSFEPDRITVKAGTRVRIRYVNESTLGHNLVVVYRDEDIDVLGAAAHDAASTGFVPMQYKDRMIAWTALASPGQSVEVEFTAPEAGSWPFVCLVDGHYNVMVGTLVSRP